MLRLKYLVLAGAAMASALSATSAAASTLLFELSGSRSATFTLSSSTVPDYMSSSFIGNQIAYSNVPGTFGGMATTAGSVSFGTFLISTFEITGTSLGFSQFAGPDLFTGPSSAPVFNLGTFNLTSIGSGNSTLVISELPMSGGVPEPSTWMLMLAGIGGTGLAFRRRARAANAALRTA